MKKGFTLLELIVVIIILGVLAILGFSQYGRMIEKSRGAEARTILGDVRKLGIAWNLEKGTMTGFSASAANLGSNPDQVPGSLADCAGSHWFYYSVALSGTTGFTGTATRCTAGGKSPQGPRVGMTVTLATNVLSGVDTWGGSGDY